MLQITRTRCCIIGFLVTHVILILAIVFAVVVACELYSDTQTQDMPGDMRMIRLRRPTAFCQVFRVSTYAERDDDAEYQTIPLFDAWSVNSAYLDSVKPTKRESRTLVGQNRLLGQAKDYYSFHWLAGSQIQAQLNATDQPQPKATTWVYFLQGDAAWQSMRRHLVANNRTVPACGEQCLERHVIDPGRRSILNVRLSINSTDDYFMVFYTNSTGDSKNSCGGQDEIDEGEESNNTTAAEETNNISNKPAVSLSRPCPFGTVWYKLAMNLTLYDTADSNMKPEVTRQSEISTRDVDSSIILDFNPKYSTPTTGPATLKDFSNIVVNVECQSRLIAYIAIFGLSAVALMIFTVIITLVIINKRFSDDFMVNSGEHTRILT